MRIRHGANTHVGLVRQLNEDSFFADDRLFVVADGMGGHEAGEVASQIAIETLVSGLSIPPGLASPAATQSAEPGALGATAYQDGSDPESEIIVNWLTQAVKDANGAIYTEGTRRGDALRMGTTLTAAYVGDSKIYVAHVGDSRAYILHASRLSQLTRDHSLVADLVSKGQISPEQATTHPQRSVITRALGIEPAVTVDLYIFVPSPGDRLLLCSDGLSGMTNDATIENVLLTEAEPDQAVSKLIDVACAGGGDDNVTAIVIDFLDTGPATSSPAERADAQIPTPSQQTSPQLSHVAVLDQGQELARDPAMTQQGIPLVSSDLDHTGEFTPTIRRRFRWKRWIAAIAVLAIVGVAGWLGASWFISNSYYVGIKDGNVAIYQGLPERLLGSRWSDLVSTLDIPVSQLPENRSQELKTGIKADNLADARKIVENLRSQVRPIASAPIPQPPPVTPPAPSTSLPTVPTTQASVAQAQP